MCLVTGSRVVDPQRASKSIGPFTFVGWGSHHTPPPSPPSSDVPVTVFSRPYISCAAGMGIGREDIDVFVRKAEKVLRKNL